MGTSSGWRGSKGLMFERYCTLCKHFGFGDAGHAISIAGPCTFNSYIHLSLAFAQQEAKMSEYWKSTPSYWCKFCHTYVRDTGIERKNHEASAKHQNSIQRSLRELHKGKEREDREKQRAKDEVARLNGLVSGKASSGGAGAGVIGAKSVPSMAPPQLSAAAQRKAHAEQLAALGVQLPDEMKKEITGVGGWQTLSERVVPDDRPGGERSLADIIKQEGESKEDVKTGVADFNIKGVHKRRAEDEDDARDEEAASRKKAAWGSRLRTYPGRDVDEDQDVHLATLLSAVAKKKQPEVKEEEAADDGSEVKKEDSPEMGKSLAAVPEIDAPSVPVKQEEDDVAPPVVFKKRKTKR